MQGFTLGQCEKNYFHNLILFGISRLFPDKLVFKGGTCLMLAYNLDRFSEDLDFNLIEEFDEKILIDKLTKFVEHFGYDIDIYFNTQTKSSLSYIIRIEGPLYVNTSQSKCRIELDISKRDDLVKKSIPKKIMHQYNEFPVYISNVLSLEEIFAEKIRAIMTRNKSRDVYDLHYLVLKGVSFDISLVNYKLSRYNIEFSYEKFVENIDLKRNIWDLEMKYLVKKYPSFEEVREDICKYLFSFI